MGAWFQKWYTTAWPGFRSDLPWRCLVSEAIYHGGPGFGSDIPWGWGLVSEVTYHGGSGFCSNMPWRGQVPAVIHDGGPDLPWRAWFQKWHTMEVSGLISAVIYHWVWFQKLYTMAGPGFRRDLAWRGLVSQVVYHGGAWFQKWYTLMRLVSEVRYHERPGFSSSSSSSSSKFYFQQNTTTKQ